MWHLAINCNLWPVLPVGGGQNLGPEMMLEDAIICPKSDATSEQELLVVLKLKLRHDGNSWQAIWQSGKLNAHELGVLSTTPIVAVWVQQLVARENTKPKMKTSTTINYPNLITVSRYIYCSLD